MPWVCTIGAAKVWNREVGLGVALLEDARAEVALAVAVHVLAVDLGSDVQVILPGDGRLQSGIGQNVGPVVDHLEVAIDHQELGLSTNLLAEFPEVRSDVVQIDLVIGGDIGVKIFQKAGRVEFYAPTGCKDADIDGVRARRPVVLNLRKDLGERDFRNDDLGAGHFLEFLAAFDKTSGDDVTRARQNIDGYPAEILGNGGYGSAAESSGANGQRSHVVAKRHYQSSQTVLFFRGRSVSRRRIA